MCIEKNPNQGTSNKYEWPDAQIPRKKKTAKEHQHRREGRQEERLGCFRTQTKANDGNTAATAIWMMHTNMPCQERTHN
jgi:hypothetical protein